MIRNMKPRIGLLVMVLCAALQASAQSSGIADEQDLYTMNKQVSQFFSRFNYEENSMGVKYLPSAPEYHNQDLRRQLLPLMFDQTNTNISPKLREMFVDDMTSSADNYFVFTGGRWYAEVTASFMQGKEHVDIILDLTVEQAQAGSKWVITKVHFDQYDEMYNTNVSDRARTRMVLHPMSHEVDFMTMRNAFQNTDYIQLYAKNDYTPDYLSIFLQDIKRGELTFEYVKNVKLHVFQMKDWYFEISNFIRSGSNSGWLISNLIYLPETEKEALIKFYE